LEQADTIAVKDQAEYVGLAFPVGFTHLLCQQAALNTFGFSLLSNYNQVNDELMPKQP
jgi:hypothetical protein